MLRLNSRIQAAEDADGVKSLVSAVMDYAANLPREGLPPVNETAGGLASALDMPHVIREADGSSSTFGPAARVLAKRNAGLGEAELAYVPSPSAIGAPGNTSITGVQPTAMMLPLLDGFAVEHPLLMNRVYREMFAYDPICGSATTMMVNFPFGDFTLSGIKNQRELAKYHSSLTSMRIQELLPLFMTDMLMLGTYIGTLKWAPEEKIISSVFSHNIDYLSIEPLPAFGENPIVRLKLPKEIMNMINSGQPEYQRLREKIPQELVEGSGTSSNGVLLNDDTLLFLANPGTVADYRGVSWYRRALPIWLTEKALIRGSLDQFWKRQRPILHAMIGDDTWIPSQKDFNGIAELILSANHDPTGAVMVTRHGIDINEIRRGDDMLKHSDMYDHFVRAKLHALGISESLFGADFSVSVAEGQINFALHKFAHFRNMITRRVFYDRVFPIIAHENGFKRSSTMTLASTREDMAQRDFRRRRDGSYAVDFRANSNMELGGPTPEHVHHRDYHKLSIPTLEWHTNLAPTGMQERMEALDKLSQIGMPIPLRLWMAAANINVENLIEQRDADIKLRRAMRPWRKEIAKDQQTAEAGMMPPTEGQEESSVLAELAGLSGRRSTVSPAAFNFTGDRYRLMTTVGGKVRQLSRAEQRRADEKANRNIAEATHSVLTHKQRAENERYREKADRKFYTPK